MPVTTQVKRYVVNLTYDGVVVSYPGYKPVVARIDNTNWEFDFENLVLQNRVPFFFPEVRGVVHVDGYIVHMLGAPERFYKLKINKEPLFVGQLDGGVNKFDEGSIICFGPGDLRMSVDL